MLYTLFIFLYKGSPLEELEPTASASVSVKQTKKKKERKVKKERKLKIDTDLPIDSSGPGSNRVQAPVTPVVRDPPRLFETINAPWNVVEFLSMAAVVLLVFVLVTRHNNHGNTRVIDSLVGGGWNHDHDRIDESKIYFLDTGMKLEDDVGVGMFAASRTLFRNGIKRS